MLQLDVVSKYNSLTLS